MNPLLLYTLKVIFCSGILLGYYWLALRNKIFHQWNRFYLLACVVLSLAAPLLTINIASRYTPPPTSVLRVLNVVAVNGEMEVESQTHNAFSLTTEQWYLLLYLLVSAVLLFIIVVNSMRIYRILRAYPKTKLDNICFLNTDAKGTPFSFFNYIVWNSAIDLNTENGERIFQHELVHVQQRHTWDKAFLLLILIPFWCNPFFWLIRKELAALHEFTADQKAMESQDASALARLILNTTFPEQNLLFTNHLFQSTIKRRIAMFTKLQHPKVNYWSRIVALPVLLLVIASFALKTKPIPTSTRSVLEKPITVVIDAAHGSYEDGARWQNIYEGEIVLAIAKRIKEQNVNKNIQIVLTRDGDQKLDLHKRVDITSGNNADLFISLHVNAAEAIKESGQLTENPANGIEIFVPSKAPRYQQQSDLIGSMLVQTLSSSYTTFPDLKKSKTRIWVIDNNVCPSVLVECGYLTNQKDRDFITEGKNQTLIANKILEAITQYAVFKNNKETSFETDTVPSRMYKNKTISDVQYFEWPKKEVHLFFADDTKDTISYAEAKAAHLFDAKAISQVEQRSWANEKNIAPNFAAGDFTVKKASIEDAKKFKGTILVNSKIFKGTFEQLPIAADEMASISMIKGGMAFPELGLKPDDSVISITTKAFLKANIRSDGDPKNEPLFLQPEIGPKFPETAGGWKVFLQKNLDASVPVKKGAKAGTYKVTVGFIVDTDGKIYDIKPLTHIGYGMEEEVQRLLKQSPDWIPALQNGKNVTSYKKQTITFVIAEG